MKFDVKQLVMVATAAGVWAGCGAAMAQQKEEDSAYRWGRWAVLSPAAGGAEPFVAALEPGSQFNPRPEDPGFNKTPELIPPSPADDPRDRPPPQLTDDPRDRPPPSF